MDKDYRDFLKDTIRKEIDFLETVQIWDVAELRVEDV
jgi:hypothetical protein